MSARMNVHQGKASKLSMVKSRSKDCLSCKHYTNRLPLQHSEGANTYSKDFYKHYTLIGFCWFHHDDLFLTRPCAAYQDNYYG